MIMENKIKTVIIDNYDSFTYNLSHLLRELGSDVTVIRNDRFALEELESFDKIVLSPGPGIPREAGALLEVIRRYGAMKPILGVCLGMQAIGEVFGARLENLSEVFHGVQSQCFVTAGDYIFDGMLKNFYAGRYHSWAVSREGFPSCLEITAISGEGQIMGLRHRDLDIHGIQFHPESILTPDGKTIIENFLKH